MLHQHATQRRGKMAGGCAAPRPLRPVCRDPVHRPLGRWTRRTADGYKETSKRPNSHSRSAARAGLEAASATSPEGAGAGGYGEEASDAGSFTSERERDLSLAGNLRDLIEKIQGALGRIDDGSYGRCEVCGQPIEAERLDALPYTTLCLADARRRARVR